jgi:hypothetical protein
LGTALPVDVDLARFDNDCEASAAEDDDRFATIPPERPRRRKGRLIIKGDGEFTSARTVLSHDAREVARGVAGR